MKLNTSISFPQFLEDDRKDVKKWFKEFDRVAEHVAGGGEMAPSEYVTMLVSSTGMKSLAGKKLRRLKDKDPLYATLEQTGEHEACKRIMVAELHTLQKSEFLQEAGVSDKFETLT